MTLLLLKLIKFCYRCLFCLCFSARKVKSIDSHLLRYLSIFSDFYGYENYFNFLIFKLKCVVSTDLTYPPSILNFKPTSLNMSTLSYLHFFSRTNLTKMGMPCLQPLFFIDIFTLFQTKNYIVMPQKTEIQFDKLTILYVRRKGYLTKRNGCELCLGP